jgi:hypothetical protein
LSAQQFNPKSSTNSLSRLELLVRDEDSRPANAAGRNRYRVFFSGSGVHLSAFGGTPSQRGGEMFFLSFLLNMKTNLHSKCIIFRID